MSHTKLETRHIIVKGKVQGVFYRQSTKEKANELGITGEVMNAGNGDVLITATGTAEQIKQLTDWCRQGPSRADVKEVIIEEKPLQEFEKFSIRRD